MFDNEQHWQQVYQEKLTTEVSWFQQDAKLSLALIQACNIAHHQGIIDVGAGASSLVKQLHNLGFSRLLVLDISAKALEKAKQHFADGGNNIDWLVADVTDFSAPYKCSLWHDRAVFHFLTTPTARRAYIDSLKNTLNIGGHIIIATFALGGPEKCSGLTIAQYDAEKLMLEFGSDFKLIEQQQELHVTPTNKEQKFNYFHLVRNR
jgi:2-polyprenyl-3-methyl-5-hydroxy-6-metoxy-1,4-benzoquinol methylase